MKHLNASSRKKTIVQFSIWFIVASAAVAVMTYAYARVDVVENKTLRSQVRIVEQSEEQRLEYDQALSELRTAMKNFEEKLNSSLPTVKKMESDLAILMISEKSNLEDALKKFDRAQNNKADSVIYNVANLTYRSFSHVLELNKEFFAKREACENDLKAKTVQISALDAEITRLNNSIEQLNGQLN